MPTASRPLFELEDAQTRLEARRAELHSLQSRLRSSPEIDLTAKQLTALEPRLKQLQSEVRTLERQAEDAAQTIKKLNDLLYGGMIHDARELASAQTEIVHARKRQEDLEDQELELLESVEATEQELTRAREVLNTLRTTRDAGMQGLRDQEHQLTLEIADTELQIRQKEASIEPKQLAMYQRTRQRLGHGVSVVTEGMCQWCRVQIPSQDVQHARGEALITCANCGRILYSD